MIRRLAILLFGLAACAPALAQQVPHPTNGPPSSTIDHGACWGTLTGNALNDCGSVRLPADNLPTPGNFYVGGAGASDANDCLAAAVAGGHGPCATLNHAIAIGLSFDAKQSSITINVGAGTYSENVAVHGPMPGAIGNAGFVNSGSIPKINLVGTAGSASTTIAGGQTIAGQSFCYAVLVDAGAQVSLQGFTITANAFGSSCNQSALYAQFYGRLYIAGDVKLGASTGFQVFAEEGGMILVTPGCGSCSGALTFVNGGIGAIGLSDLSTFQSDSPIAFSGQTYSQETFDIESGSHLKLLGNPPWTGPWSGEMFNMDSSAGVETYFPGTVGAGNQGKAASGAYWKNAQPQMTVLSSTGLGSAGTIVVSTGSDPYRGSAVLQPNGADIAALGTVVLNVPYDLLGASCSVSWQNTGDGSFQLGSVFAYSTNQPNHTLTLDWSNGGLTALTAGQGYPLAWLCR